MNLTKIIRERLKLMSGGAQQSSNNNLIVRCEKNPCEEIGKGNFGEVYKGAYKENDGADCYKHVGLKVLKLANEDYVKKNFELTNTDKINKKVKKLNNKSTKEFDNEKKISLHLTGNTNVVKFYGETKFPGDINRRCLVFEYCKHGDLKKYLDPDPEILNYDQKIKILKQICEGMAFIHGQKVLHRDLAARNIFLDKDKNAKVADFGLAVKADKLTYLYKRGTIIPIRYMSPKFFENNKTFNIQTDLWAFGIIVWEIFTDKRVDGKIPAPYNVNRGVQKILENPKNDLVFFTNDFETNNKTANAIIRQCFEPAFDDGVKDRTFKDLLTFITVPTTGGSRKKKRTLKKERRPKKQSKKTRKARK